MACLIGVQPTHGTCHRAMSAVYHIVQTPAPLFATCLAAATYPSSFFPLLLCHIVWPRICFQTRDALTAVACAVTAAIKQALNNK